jgi:5-enolpyruvylshikimate-3-phosphate synthase
MSTVSINITINSKDEVEVKTNQVENPENFKFEGDLEFDSAAYLLAAGYFLHSWPDSWTGERLAMALLMEDGDIGIEEQMQVKVWYPLMEYCVNQKKNPFLFAEEQISSLAEDFLRIRKYASANK